MCPNASAVKERGSDRVLRRQTEQKLRAAGLTRPELDYSDDIQSLILCPNPECCRCFDPLQVMPLVKVKVLVYLCIYMARCDVFSAYHMHVRPEQGVGSTSCQRMLFTDFAMAALKCDLCETDIFEEVIDRLLHVSSSSGLLHVTDAHPLTGHVCRKPGVESSILSPSVTCMLHLTRWPPSRRSSSDPRFNSPCVRLLRALNVPRTHWTSCATTPARDSKISLKG